ncbi:hypothetical protein [Altererythrobacter sp. ZODW24]|uniref:hypothetical protein n=1 Tax=Altererythrobacter sp. ZODW24 TaxID=2185142 RepID=UPI0013B36BBA|nr:hypothetical protein [Altererythrobacter sp. ZODW24]
MKSIKTGAATLALLALSQPQMAMAQECLAETDVSDAVVYAMPSLITAVQTKCDDVLIGGGYLDLQGEALKSRFDARSDQAWPGAKRVIEVYLSRKNKGDQTSSMLASLPDDALSPFVAALITAEVADEIPLKECANVERGLELLDPLPPENVGGLMGFIFRLAGVKKPSICPMEEN